jgi:hypothetical protein
LRKELRSLGVAEEADVDLQKSGLLLLMAT